MTKLTDLLKIAGSALLAVPLLTLGARADITYADGENNPAALELAAGEIATLTVENEAAIAAHSGAISGSDSATLFKAGDGTLIVAGDLGTFAGSITVAGGTLDLSQTGTNNFAGVTLAGGTLRIANAAQFGANFGAAFFSDFNFAPVTLRVAQGGNVALDGGGTDRNHFFTEGDFSILLETGASFSVTNSGGNFGGFGEIFGRLTLDTASAGDTSARFRFENNFAEHNGGALSNLYELNVANADFIGNFVDDSTQFGGGGAIENVGTAIIARSTFTGNSADGDGGAIVNYSGDLTVSDSVFTGNSTSEPLGSGGAIASYGGTLTFSNVRFENNYSEYGGAVANAGAALQIDGAVFTGNTATHGGALLHDAFGDASVNDATFSDNSATYGGAILVTDTSALSLRNATFLNNAATAFGGAVFIDNSPGDVVVRVSADAGKTSIFQGNTASGAANSFYFGTLPGGFFQTAFGNATLIVEGAGDVKILDPIAVNITDGREFVLVKTQTGNLYWGGANTVTAAGGSTVYLAYGTTHLVSDFSLSAGAGAGSSAVNVSGFYTELRVETNAAIRDFSVHVTESAKLILAGATLSVDNLELAEGTTLRFAFVEAGGVLKQNFLEITGGAGALVLGSGEGVTLEFDFGNPANLNGVTVIDLIKGIAPEQLASLHYGGATLNVGDNVTLAGKAFRVSLAGGTLSLVETAPVPEPSTYALAGALVALGAGVVFRKRRR